MKKISIIALAAVGTLSACGKTDRTRPVTSNDGPRNIRVMASFYPIYIAAKNVIGDTPGVTLENMTSAAGADVHDYALNPADLKKIDKTDVMIINGAGMERFMDKILAQRADLPVINASEGFSRTVEVMEHGKMTLNPHIWLSPDGAIWQVMRIAKGLSDFHPAGARAYNANAEAYIAKISALKQATKTLLAEKRLSGVVTFHEAFPYFAQDFGLNIVAVIEREPGSEPSAAELAATIDKIKKLGGNVALFAEPQYPKGPAQTIAAETGLTLYTLDPVESGPDSADAYLDAMKKNLEELSQALRLR